jgi:hypothetical protein
MNEVYKKLREINVSGHVEQKNGLNYLSWAWAWDEVMKEYPDAIYEIERFDNKPYLYDEKTGYMVFTRMSIAGVEREMWLPVMDAANKAMLDHKYTYDTKFKKDIPVEAATMFDINKTIMRCLVKNLAMFGLGLALYSGEDLPEEELTEEIAKEFIFEKGKYTGKSIMDLFNGDEKEKGYLQWWLDNGKDEKIKAMITILTGMKPTEIPPEEEQKEILNKMVELDKLLNDTNTDRIKFYKYYKVDTNQQMTLEQLNDGIEKLKAKL